MENKLKISKRLVILLIISLIMPLTILADTVAFKTVVSKNDMVVSGDFWLDVQMQITAGTSPRTLNSLTADVYFGNEITYSSADNWAYSFLDGYSRSANDLTTYIRVGTTGNNVNANLNGTPAGWNVTTSWQTVVTLKFTIATATSVNISINDATDAAAYFNNISNNPTGAVTDWTVTNEDGGDITLPVELSSFTAQFIGSSPILCWTTQSETGNAGWNVYRGDYRDAFINGDAIQINPVLIEGAGTTSIPTDYTFEDQYNVIAGNEYWYILESVDYSGETQIPGSVSLVIPEEGTTPELPQITVLIGNYPNPFNPETIINFMVKENETAHLSIFNIKGQKVENITFEAGIYNYLWDASSYASGIYLYKLKSESFSEIRKMILLK